MKCVCLSPSSRRSAEDANLLRGGGKEQAESSQCQVLLLMVSFDGRDVLLHMLT